MKLMNLDLEAQPSLDPEENEKMEDEDEDESYPLLHEGNQGASGATQSVTVSNSKSLRRQYR